MYSTYNSIKSPQHPGAEVDLELVVYVWGAELQQMIWGFQCPLSAVSLQWQIEVDLLQAPAGSAYGPDWQQRSSKASNMYWNIQVFYFWHQCSFSTASYSSVLHSVLITISPSQLELLTEHYCLSFLLRTADDYHIYLHLFKTLVVLVVCMWCEGLWTVSSSDLRRTEPEPLDLFV